MFLLATATLLCISKVSGFFPTRLRTGGGLLGQAHTAITDSAIEELNNEFFGLTTLSKPMRKARDQISDANADVDDDQNDAVKHFDGESLPEGQARLIALFGDVVTALQSDNAQGARQKLGQALHTLQDFYSHSSWVELGNLSPHPGLGRPGNSLPRLSSTTTTCADCNGGLPPVLCPDCSANFNGVGLTSGYYGGESPPFAVKPAGKCSHGGGFDTSATGFFGEGINKDSLDCEFSPHNFLHATAAELAKEATKQFIRDIHDKVTLRQLKQLLGVGPTLAIAIDTTGSMGSIIDQVKNQALDLVDSRLDTDEEPSRYVLTPFNDPGVGPTTFTTDVDTFKNSIRSLFASGGGDCPELAMTGMLQALAETEEGGELFMFTDASAKDSGLAGNVSSLALSKQIRVYPFLFGSCSPIDPGYILIANTSGGQLFFLAPSEAGRVAQLAKLLVRSRTVDLLSVSDAGVAAKTYPFAVDSTVSQITISVSGTTTITIERPDGSFIADGQRGVSAVVLSSGMLLSVENPMTGGWTITTTSVGTFSVNVSGLSPLDVDSFRFVEPFGRVGHDGVRPIAGLPTLDQEVLVDAKMTEGFKTAGFELRTKAGEKLMSLPLELISRPPQNEFAGKVVLPNSSFLVYAVGTDSNGAEYQRVLAGLTRPQAVAVSAPASVDLVAGQLTRYTFVVRNQGDADTFNVMASDDQRFLTSLTPRTFALPTGASAEVSVELRPPLNTRPGTSDTLTLTVQSSSLLDVKNFGVVRSIVTGPVINHAPVAQCQNQTVLAGPECTRNALIDNGSFDPDLGDTISRTQTPSGPYPVGETVVLLTVTDSHGLSDSCSATVTVIDKEKPTIEHLTVTPDILWPPNHSLCLITVNYTVSDNCGIANVALKASSNEPDNGLGDGDTSNDIRLVPGDPHHLYIRAERSGKGTDRLYTVSVIASDFSGNTETADITVKVPHNNNK